MIQNTRMLYWASSFVQLWNLNNDDIRPKNVIGHRNAVPEKDA